MNIISLPGPNVSHVTTLQVQGQNNVKLGGTEELHNMNFGSHPGPNALFVTTPHVQGQNDVNLNFVSLLDPNAPVVTTPQVQGQNNVKLGGTEELHNMNFGSHPDPNALFVTTPQVQDQNDVNLNFVFLLDPNAPVVTTPQVQGQNDVNLGEAEEEHNMNFVSIPFPNTFFEGQLYNQQVQNGNNLGEVEEHSVNTSLPPDPIETHPQIQTQQSLSNQLFQPSSNIILHSNVQPEVTDGSVSQFLNQPELFAEIRGSSTFCANDYIKNKKKCNWKPATLKLFLSLLEQRKEVVRQLTSNHGYVKKDLWENISYTLSQRTNENFSPLQCAHKWKNIKQTYKKNSEYQYKSEVDSILGNNWHKSDTFERIM